MAKTKDDYSEMGKKSAQRHAAAAPGHGNPVPFARDSVSWQGRAFWEAFDAELERLADSGNVADHRADALAYGLKLHATQHGSIHGEGHSQNQPLVEWRGPRLPGASLGEMRDRPEVTLGEDHSQRTTWQTKTSAEVLADMRGLAAAAMEDQYAGRPASRRAGAAPEPLIVIGVARTGWPAVDSLQHVADDAIGATISIYRGRRPHVDASRTDALFHAGTQGWPQAAAEHARLLAARADACHDPVLHRRLLGSLKRLQKRWS